jgi:hypothetical protein
LVMLRVPELKMPPPLLPCTLPPLRVNESSVRLPAELT